MTADDWRLSQAKRWLYIAGRDLRTAQLLAVEAPYDSVFHSQQCAEKALKALLASRDVSFRRTHDLQELGAQAAGVLPHLAPVFQKCEDLTSYAVTFRYFEAPYEPDEAEAADALARATALYDAVKSELGL